MNEPDRRKQAVSAWTILESHYSVNDRWMKLRSDTVQLPNGRILAPYYTIEYPNWVEVIAITPELNVVLCEQYRHGVRKVMLEFPGGAISAGEAPQAAIERELREETGYVSDSWRSIGVHMSESARQTNRIHVFLALGARKASGQALDDSEDIRPLELPWHEFTRQIAAGELTLAGSHMAGLSWLQLLAVRSTDETIRRLRW